MSTPKITIIDYDLSNLFSVQQACNHLGLGASISKDPNEIANSDGIILPGVGAFNDAMINLKKLGLIQPILNFINSDKPFMGVCLGMQLLFTESEEFGNSKGLNIIPGVIKKFPAKSPVSDNVKVPQIGWNTIEPQQVNNLSWEKSPLKSLAPNDYMYFVHSYYAIPANETDALSITNYEGIRYCSSVLKNNVFATQFHPEKSANKGLSIYKNWFDINF